MISWLNIMTKKMGLVCRLIRTAESSTGCRSVVKKIIGIVRVLSLVNRSSCENTVVTSHELWLVMCFQMCVSIGWCER